MNITIEPIEAFPYNPPTKEILIKYKHIFEIREQLPPRFIKIFFDKEEKYTLPPLLFLPLHQ